jgi:hypothetical protein
MKFFVFFRNFSVKAFELLSLPVEKLNSLVPLFSGVLVGGGGLMESKSSSTMAADIVGDIQELRQLLHYANRPRVQSLLSSHISGFEKVWRSRSSLGFDSFLHTLCCSAQKGTQTQSLSFLAKK